MPALTRYRKNQLGRYARAFAGGRIARFVYNRMRGSRASAIAAARGRSFTGTQRRRVRTGQGVTDQFDRRVIYRKRSMPRYKKRRWRSFVKKVHAASEKSLGTRTVVFNDKLISSGLNILSNATQVVQELALYPFQCSRAHEKDINKILNNDNSVSTTGKFLFQSGVLDLTFQNTSFKNEANPSSRGDPHVEVDVYEIVAGREFDSLPVGSGLTEIFINADGDTPLINAGSSISIADRGVTPFDLPSALSEFRVKILKKTKYTLSPLQSVTYQMRDPRRHVIDKQLQNMQSANKRGLTRFLFILTKPLPNSVPSDTAPDVYQIELGVTRKYMYKINEREGEADGYNIP